MRHRTTREVKTWGSSGLQFWSFFWTCRVLLCEAWGVCHLCICPADCLQTGQSEPFEEKQQKHDQSESWNINTHQSWDFGLEYHEDLRKGLCRLRPVVEPEHQIAGLLCSRYSHMTHSVKHPVQNPGHFIPVQPHILQLLRSNHRVDSCRDVSDRDLVHWQNDSESS